MLFTGLFQNLNYTIKSVAKQLLAVHCTTIIESLRNNHIYLKRQKV